MQSKNFLDPRGEYKRICPYCKEAFTADHMNRFYCPEKNGIQNFCKHRFKRLINELRENGIEIERPERPPLKLLFEPENKDFRNIDDEILKTILNRKIQILNDVLGENDSKTINWDELQKRGFQIDNEDKFITNDYGTLSPLYDDIFLIRKSINEIQINKLKK
ncbi:MAG: hypothetical protein FGM14_16815 [Flavobacteriales bacterium]|nr:hypothetical protein [Flavobacteriales bacterium]